MIERQTIEQARQFFSRLNLTVAEFERDATSPIMPRYEAIVTNGFTLQIWAWDASHGCGYWHRDFYAERNPQPSR